jgi:hypothetical protein
MRTTLAATAALLAVLGSLFVTAGAMPAGGAVTAAEYCVISDPIYYQGREIWSGGEYCVPGP